MSVSVNNRRSPQTHCTGAGMGHFLNARCAVAQSSLLLFCLLRVATMPNLAPMAPRWSNWTSPRPSRVPSLSWLQGALLACRPGTSYHFRQSPACSRLLAAGC